MRWTLRCPDCGLFGTWESFKREDAAAEIECCPGCQSEAIEVDETWEEFDVELAPDEEVTG